jgi:hypothetical protein
MEGKIVDYAYTAHFIEHARVASQASQCGSTLRGMKEKLYRASWDNAGRVNVKSSLKPNLSLQSMHRALFRNHLIFSPVYLRAPQEIFFDKKIYKNRQSTI